MSGRPAVSVVVPTWNGGRLFRHLANHLAAQQARGAVEPLIIDSGSSDGTPEYAESVGLRVHRIPNAEFGHGRTRNLGASLTTCPLVCFVTQDVLPVTPDWPERVVSYFADESLAGLYARQVPRDAETMEMFFVAQNYPAESVRYDPNDGPHQPRPRSVVFSNAFSVVRRDRIEEVPFEDNLPVSEDQVWALRQLRYGRAILYAADIEVLHAHRYGIRDLWRRSRLIGQAFELANMGRGATFLRGLAFLADEVHYFLGHGHAHRVPQLVLYEAVRWVGYRWGRYYVRSSRSAAR